MLGVHAALWAILPAVPAVPAVPRLQRIGCDPPRMNVVDVMPFWDNNFYTVQPTFEVRDWAAARPLMAEYLDKVRTERGAMYCGWTISGDMLCCREGFHDADAVIAHMANVQPVLDQLLANAATLCTMEVHGPASGLKTCQGALESLEARYFEIDSGCTFLVRPYAGMSRGQSHFSLHPTFKVVDWDAVRPVLDESIESMRLTSGCVFYGWTRRGDTLFGRHAFLNADGVRRHLASTDALVASLVSSGAVTLTSVSVHGPPTRLGEVKAALHDYHGLTPQYFAIDSGFQKFECSGFNLGMLDYNKFD